MSGAPTFPASAVAVDVRAYGAKADGTADDTAAVAAALAAASAAGGGTVYFPAGTCVTGTQTLPSGVTLAGAGRAASTLKLKSGTNADLVQGVNAPSLVNLSAAFGAGNAGGISGWGIRDLTLDGNKAGQASGTSYCLRAYGYAFTVHSVDFARGRSGNVLVDWNGGDLSTGPQVEALWSDIRCYDAGGIGMQIGGPHDSAVVNAVVMESAGHNIHICPNATGMMWANVHSWGAAWSASAVEWLVESPACQFVNCVGEGSDATNVVVLGENTVWAGGSVYGAGVLTVYGMQLGQQGGQAPWPGQVRQSGGVTTAKAATGCVVDGRFTQNNNGSIRFVNEAWNTIRANAYQDSGTWNAGTPDSTTSVEVLYNGVRDMRVAGGIATGQTPAAQVLASSGTVATAGVGVARVNPSGAVTGVVLAVGVVPGQQVAVLNESAFTVTFAAAGTSHVADGASDAIAALTARSYIWNSGTSLWYRAA